MKQYNASDVIKSIWHSLLVLVAVAGSSCASHPARLPSGSVTSDPTAVKIRTQRDGSSTRFYVENAERTEVTMTFDIALKNLRGSVGMPYTQTFAPGETEAFELAPVETGVSWGYSYTNYYKLGSTRAVHDDSYAYLLPYEAGKRFRITQGYNGSFSHKGSNQYALDWQMPEGTPVCAARDGLVVKVKDDSDLGGADIRYDRFNNYVLIRHSDGTLGHYCHLKKGGVCVSPGQMVEAGQMIAHSGSTGFSSGPHLHFSVFKTLDGLHRVSIPVKFRTADALAITLAEGRSYRAAPATRHVEAATLAADTRR